MIFGNCTPTFLIMDMCIVFNHSKVFITTDDVYTNNIKNGTLLSYLFLVLKLRNISMMAIFLNIFSGKRIEIFHMLTIYLLIC
ncbi:LOW QUALITY PROTEIN: hypothetical protein HZS_336 [Henneguya salminicola]|nr:LOW QUALITY PROTEIN: hypothetical protein HZS_336 [Henneguya salminicola]